MATAVAEHGPAQTARTISTIAARRGVVAGLGVAGLLAGVIAGLVVAALLLAWRLARLPRRRLERV